MLKAERPALIFLNGLGDHFINLPAVRATAAIYPDRLTLLCRKGGGRAFTEAGIGRIVELDCGDTRRDLALLSDAAIHALKGCDVLLSLNPWHTEAMDTLLARVKPYYSVGFFPAFDLCLPLNFSKHSADLAFDLPRALGSVATLSSCSEPLPIDAAAVESARRILELLPRSARMLAVHVDTITEKMWNKDRLDAALHSFLARNTDFFAFVVGVREVVSTGNFVDDRVISCVGLPFWTSVAIVRESDLFLGMDSCMLHAADLFRVPGVGVFGPTDPHEFGFRMSRHRHVTGRGGLESIAEDQVVEALETLWLEVLGAGVPRIGPDRTPRL